MLPVTAIIDKLSEHFGQTLSLPLKSINFGAWVPFDTHLGEIFQNHASSVQSTRSASNVTFALSSFETGQFAFAVFASSTNFDESAPGIFAFNVRCTAEIAYPPSTLSSDTSAVVSMCSAVSCASPRMRDGAMVKHAARAAPMASSGLVPGFPSNRSALSPGSHQDVEGPRLRSECPRPLPQSANG